MDLSNMQKAVEFLKDFIPNGLWVLTAIDPEKKRNIETRTFSAATADQAEDWIIDRYGRDNLYFSVNQPEQGDYGKKLKKEDIAVVNFLHVDVDPAKGKEIDLQRKQIFDKLTVRRPETVPRPSVIVDSGGGYQAFWRLSEPQLVENKAQREAVELFNIWLAAQLGGDNCHDISRIMRLPWTMNIPNEQKKAAGRVEALAKPRQVEEIAYKLADFSLEAPELPEGDQGKHTAKKVDVGGIEAEIEQELAEGPIYVEDIEEFGNQYSIPRRTLHIIVDGKGDDEETLKKTQAGKDVSRSEWLFDVTCELERRDVPRRIILGIITEPNTEKFAISASVLEHDTGPIRYGTKQIRSAAKVVAEQRLEARAKAEKMLELDNEDRQELIYSLCYGERASLTGVRSRQEAEENDPLLQALNSYLCVVRSVGGGKPRVVSFSTRPEIGNGKMLMLDKTTFSEFQLQYKGPIVTVGFAKSKDDNHQDKPITKPLADWWLSHRFKNIKERITFAPEKKLPGVLNEWTGFTYPEDPNGRYDLFLEHMRENICSGNQEHYDYLIKWCARMYQYPGETGQVGLFLKGGSGVGKSVFVKVLGNLIASNFFETAQIKKLSNFNSVLRTTVLLFLDEAVFSGDKKQYDLLKKLMVNDTLDIEAKGYEQETVANCLHIAFASNHAHVAQVESDDRRLFILEVGDKRKGDDDYFNQMYDQLEVSDNSGYKALFHYFRNLDLADFKVARFPKTEILAEQKDLSLDARETWLLDRLEDGELIKGTGLWPEDVSTALVHADFIQEMKDIQPRYIDKGKTLLGRFLGAIIGTTAKTVRIKENGISRTVSGYRVPMLKEARKAWGKKYGDRTWQVAPDEPEKVEEPEVETNVIEGKYTKENDNTPF